MARSLALVAMAAALVSAAWLELERDPNLVALLEVLALALAPALALSLLRRRLIAGAVLALASLTAASLAFAVPLTDMRPGTRDFFGPAGDAFADGFRDMYETKHPFLRLDHPELAGLVLLAIFLLVAACGLLVVARRRLWAGGVLLAGVGMPTTVSATAAGSAPLRTGAVVLGALLVLLFLSRRDVRPLRGLGPALGLGGVIVAVAVAASTSSAVVKDAFVPWQRWDFYDQPAEPVGVRYVWNSSYTGIEFPEKATVVLRIKAPKHAVYWRATTLDDYTGVGWREKLLPGPSAVTSEVTGALAEPLLPALARDAKSWVQQDVTVVALSDTHLVAATEPVKWQLRDPARVRYAPGGVVLKPEGLTQGEHYTVWSYEPKVQPKELAALPARYPAALDRFLEVVPDVRLPSLGARGRDRAVEKLFRERSYDALLAEYEPLYRKARELAGEATSPYVIAVTLETWFRSGGGFVYEEQPEQPLDSTPPLVDFVLRTKEGYCQQYAGAMAVMLRLLGIPARVGAGFTSGTYDDRKGEWTVTDHNAHTWVEVWFPKYGWLPFDPTPGRGRLTAAYSATSVDFEVNGLNALGVAASALSPLLRERLRGALPDGASAGAPQGERRGPSSTVGGDGGVGVAGLVFLVIAAALALLVGLKALRRELRFLGRDPRRVATACRRDLVAFLSDQRFSFQPSATLTEVGDAVERAYRVNATPFVRAATAARFGPPDSAADAARRARRELRSLERQIRKELGLGSRARGLLSLRSLAA